MPRDGADHHDLRGVCQGNRCGRESAEYIDDLRTADGILKTARESGSVALSLVGVRFAEDSTLEGDGFELPVPRKLGLRRGRRLALHLGSLNAPAARPRSERDQAAPGFGEEGEHCRRVIKRRSTASKARPELGALLGLKAVRFGASNAVL